MTAITPLTAGFHEITPLTTKSERCYNHPPLYKVRNDALKALKLTLSKTRIPFPTRSLNSPRVKEEFQVEPSFKSLKSILSKARI